MMSQIRDPLQRSVVSSTREKILWTLRLTEEDMGDTHSMEDSLKDSIHSETEEDTLSSSTLDETIHSMCVESDRMYESGCFMGVIVLSVRPLLVM